MLKVVTAKEMQQIDRITIEKYGIAGAVLMERAGLAVVRRINGLYPDKKVIVLCGGGNNGGDGFVIARELFNLGREVEVCLSSNPAALKGDARINFNAAIKFGVKIYTLKNFLSHLASRIKPHYIIIDALFGTGLSKEVRSPLSTFINKVNRMSCPVVSVDIPSGISSDTGQIMGCAIKAEHTVTFGLPKRGHLLYPGAEHTGKLYVEDIGFPRRLLASEKIKIDLIQKGDAVSLLPPRPAYSHKGTYGHVLLVAGSKGKTGAALMAARACLKTGAGLVTVGMPESLVTSFQSRVTEEMILPLPDKGDGTVSYEAAETIMKFVTTKANVLAIGPGLSVNNEIVELVSLLVSEVHMPMVIDADGLNAVSQKVNILKKAKAPLVLTPHPGEMAGLLRQSKEFRGQGTGLIRKNIEKDRLTTASEFAVKNKVHLVLKGAPTVIAAPDGTAVINSSGNPGMAKAGTGDVLTGIVAAFLAQGMTPSDAAVLGVYIHGLSGDAAAEKKGTFSMTATDIINAIPSIMKSIKPL